MCVSVAAARFSRTVLYAGEGRRDGSTVHVLGYQNTPQNRAPTRRRHMWWARAGSANAMLLHFPAVPGTMTKANVVETEMCPHILGDMVDAAYPVVTRGGGALPTAEPTSVEVFEHGIYTIVLAADAAAIPDALRRVPRRRRPAPNPRLFEWYADRFPRWPVALCCFDNREAARATPMLWWYEPKFPDLLFAPAIDAHDGDVPDLERSVDVDHVVLLGTSGAGDEVVYSDPLPEGVRSLLPTHVAAASFRRRLPNADFVIETDRAARPTPGLQRRVLAA